MADCTPLKPAYLEIIQPVDMIAQERKGQGDYTISGGALSASGSPDMKVNMDEWAGALAQVRNVVVAGYVTADAQDATYDRIDIPYITRAGVLALHKGTPAAQVPIGVSDWKRYELPQPNAATLPDGVILGKVLIKSTANGGGHIDTADIYMGTVYGPDDLSTIKRRITHDGGASQTIYITPDFCDVDKVATKCVEGSTIATVELGYSGDTAALMTNAEVPKTLNAKYVNRDPIPDLQAVKTIIATVGGGDSVGEWDVWIKLTRFV